MKHRGLLLTILSGILLSLTIPPINLKILAWVALVPLFIAINKQKSYKAFFFGLITGLIYFCALTYWIILYKVWVLLVTIIFTSTFTAFFCLIISYFQKKLKKGILIILSPAIVWIALAFVYSFSPIGSSWTNIGILQNIYLLQIISTVGTGGITFLILTVNSVIAYSIIYKSVHRKFLLVLILLIISCFIYGAITIPDRINGNIPIAIIQPSFPYNGEWRPTHVDAIFDTYYNLSLKASKQAKIIVWPQYNLPIDVYRNPEKVARIAKKTKSYIMLGTFLMENEKGYNIALLFSPEGKIVGRYDATHPTPFREGVTPGDDYIVFNTSYGKIAILLCYDDITPITTRKFVKNDAELLFSLMNNGMFDKTTLPYHHLSSDVLRAIENRRFIVRDAASGISAIIDPYGRILKKADVSKQQIILGKVSLRQDKTFYNKYGSIISYVCLILTLYLTTKVLIGKNKRKRHK